jgi:conjugal transfer pilus assembly protein TraW
VEGLTETQEERIFFYDPTLILSTDIKDAQNRILFPKGTVYNPLTQVSWGNAWVFLDGENPQHQYYAQTHPDETIILIKGKPLVLEERLQRPVYFDQGGRLTQKFGIGQIPCRITQEGQRLKIHEFNVQHKQGEKHHEHHP